MNTHTHTLIHTQINIDTEIKLQNSHLNMYMHTINTTVTWILSIYNLCKKKGSENPAQKLRLFLYKHSKVLSSYFIIYSDKKNMC